MMQIAFPSMAVATATLPVFLWTVRVVVTTLGGRTATDLHLGL